jgi:hypothetical protein
MNKIFQIIILFFIFSLVIISCSSAKKLTKEDTLIENEFNRNDSIKNTVVNKEINDKLITSVIQSQTGNASLDSLVNAKIDEILSKLNTSKNSGDNSYNLIYDKIKRQLEFNARIAQTQDEKLAVQNNSSRLVFRDRKIPVEVIKPLSKIEKTLLILGVLAIIYIGFRILLFLRKTSGSWL